MSSFVHRFGRIELPTDSVKSGIMDKLIDDEMLVTQFQAGRQNAFDELMKRYKSKNLLVSPAFGQKLRRR